MGHSIVDLLHFIGIIDQFDFTGDTRRGTLVNNIVIRTDLDFCWREHFVDDKSNEKD
jgi:hypothetical protein